MEADSLRLPFLQELYMLVHLRSFHPYINARLFIMYTYTAAHFDTPVLQIRHLFVKQGSVSNWYSKVLPVCPHGSSPDVAFYLPLQICMWFTLQVSLQDYISYLSLPDMF